MPIKIKLTILNFLQYFAWGAWLLSTGSYLATTLEFSGIQIGAVYGTMGIASLFMPALLGIIADKWINTERVLGASHIILGCLLILLSTQTSFTTFYPIVFLASMFYMPTIALTNSLSYAILEKEKEDIVKVFPKIRVWGTIGFILAVWSVDILDLGITPYQYLISSGASIFLGIFAFTLPAVKPTGNQKKKTLAQQFGLDAFILFKKKKVAIFLIFSMLLGCVLQISNMWGDGFLRDFTTDFSGYFIVEHSLMFITLSMISETLFILTIPFFLKKFGIKKVMLMSMFAWVLRFALFGIGDPGTGAVFLTLSMIVYGMAFDFFNISGSLFIEKEADKSIRSSSQGLFMLMTNGLGAIIGAYGSGYIVDLFTANGVKDWTSIWIVFAAYSLTVMLIFSIVFKYKHNPNEELEIKH